ncbi:hypothetical protein ANN_15648 [Periplaneta americana]|uniref:Uncharacterized protein n=1 Tax=Periplaneta americana TaxID=6978 RepID=A0ABQ8SGY3_PERAM|nr:hypothetical protein ANN_15648 [Periplaneta americana]
MVIAVAKGKNFLFNPTFWKYNIQVTADVNIEVSRRSTVLQSHPLADNRRNEIIWTLTAIIIGLGEVDLYHGTLGRRISRR